MNDFFIFFLMNFNENEFFFENVGKKNSLSGAESSSDAKITDWMKSVKTCCGAC